MLDLLFITNDIDIARIAEKSGVNRIWIDLETKGKEERQQAFNTVISRHCIEDIRRISPVLSAAKTLVRINPWDYDSKKEIDDVIDAGADIIMLPYWKSIEEAWNFLSYVNKRIKTILLLETKEAVNCLKDVVNLPLLDEIHVGLNDLRISYGYSNMFEAYANGLLEYISAVINEKDVPFGIGGIGSFFKTYSPTPQELILEQYRLGSKAVILSRSFCDVNEIKDVIVIEETLKKGIETLRQVESEAMQMSIEELYRNHLKVVNGFFYK